MSVSGTLGINRSNLFPCILRPMVNLRKQAEETLKDVSQASVKVGETVEWAGPALLAVAGVSLIALLVAAYALGKVSNAR